MQAVRGMLLMVSVVTAGVAAVGVPQQVWRADQGNGVYVNPVLHADYSDPDVVRVGADYYMVASSFNAVPGLPVLHSTDLVNWRLLGHALPRLTPEDVFATPQHGKGPWAPAIRHHAGKFWVFYPDPDLGIYVVTATNPAGPWSAPVQVKAGKGLIDPCPLWDDDGQVYLVHAWARSRAGFANVITLNRLSPDATRVIDEGTIVINGDQIPGYRTLEGPKFYKRSGEYWIFAPAGGVKPGWQSVFRAKTVGGPYEHRIVLEQGTTDINGPHQGAWVDTASGQHWFLHFQDMDAYGRVVHLQPMAWRPDGWPVMGRDADGDGRGEPVRAARKPEIPKGGDVVEPPASDDFDAPRMGLQWQWQANPRPEWWSLSEKPGALRLKTQPLAVASNLYLAPHLLLQKFPAPAFTVTAQLAFSPRLDGEAAGLTVFGQDYAWVGLVKTGDELRLVMRISTTAKEGKPEREAASVPAGGGPVFLRADVLPGGRCRFSYSRDNTAYLPIGEEFLARPGVWVGAKVGLFASAPPGAAAAGHADWEWVRVEPRRPQS